MRDTAIALYEFAARMRANAASSSPTPSSSSRRAPDGELVLIDEVLTPDSSRFWPADTYREGISPPSFDKQFVRDYLETLDWNKQAPAPKLPPEIIAKTSAKYLEALHAAHGLTPAHARRGARADVRARRRSARRDPAAG